MSEDRYELAREGKKLWDQLDERLKADKYVVMPHLNHEYNRFAVKYLKNYIDKFSIKKIVFIHLPDEIMQFEKIYAYGADVEYVSISEDDMNKLIILYGLYKFSDKVTIVSLTKPYDTGAERLLGIKGTTFEELFCFDIYKFDSIPKGE